MGWLRIGLNDLLFYLMMLAILVMLAWLSGRYDNQWDWTHQGSNSLSRSVSISCSVSPVR